MPREIAASLCGSENLDWMSCRLTFRGRSPNRMIRALLAGLVTREDQDAMFVILHTRRDESLEPREIEMSTWRLQGNER
jgi:hypothetical protein